MVGVRESVVGYCDLALHDRGGGAILLADPSPLAIVGKPRRRRERGGMKLNEITDAIIGAAGA